jgi:hypothetical protein
VSSEPFDVDGVLHLSIETVAELYRVRTVWLEEALDRGLVAAGRAPRAIAITELDRVATVVRLHVVLGLEQAAIELLLAR